MHVYGGYQDLRGSSSELWTFDFSEFNDKSNEMSNDISNDMSFSFKVNILFIMTIEDSNEHFCDQLIGNKSITTIG